MSKETSGKDIIVDAITLAGQEALAWMETLLYLRIEDGIDPNNADFLYDVCTDEQREIMRGKARDYFESSKPTVDSTT